jgi:hypothetical protein
MAEMVVWFGFNEFGFGWFGLFGFDWFVAYLVLFSG